jgi:DNA-binding MarR family transcriptional regulator
LGLKTNRPSELNTQSLGVLLKRAEQAMLKSKNAALKPIGLTLAQYVALSELEAQQGITAATLARACFVSPQAMMILLKTMEQQGLIERRAHPRHPNVLELNLTEVGREAFHAGRARIAPLEKKVSNTFTDKELKGFRASLVAFIAASEAD